MPDRGVRGGRVGPDSEEALQEGQDDGQEEEEAQDRGIQVKENMTGRRFTKYYLKYILVANFYFGIIIARSGK